MPTALPGFSLIHSGRRSLYLRDDLAGDAEFILDRIDQIGRTSRSGAGNRRGGFPIDIGRPPDLFLRRARRGGLLSWFNRDLYFGRNPRPVRELAITVAAAQRGIPVAEPMGALVEAITRNIYRGAMITRALTGMTLWQFLNADEDRAVRLYLLEEARRVIDLMHRGGLDHADLNLHNLFVTRSGENFAVVVLDLDKARLSAGPLSTRLRRCSLQRLVRSARKLDPRGKLLDSTALATLIKE